MAGIETSSPGEKELFERFRTEADTDGWVVLHSLDLPNHRRQLMGEIDFVVIVPGLGIVCLEVKSHRTVSRDPDGMWHLGQDRPTRIGPFRQASEGMHSLRQHVVSKAHGFRHIVFWSAVCFTRVPFELQSAAEWHHWQVIDAAALSGRSLGSLVRSVLVNARDHIASKPGGAWFDATSGDPTLDQIDSLVKILRPGFEFYESPRSRRRQREGELLRFTEEQYVALDAMIPSLNPRVLFEGAAGTGKTVLALEECRRSVLREERILLCCFNRLLGAWLSAETAPLGPTVTTQTFHRFMLDMFGHAVPNRVGDEFWQRDLPDAVLEKALSPGYQQFDVVILDEAQDLLRDNYLDVIDAILVGGLATGRWRMFGDFETQALYGSANRPIAEVLASRAPGTPRYQLTRNCRNTPRIASYVALLAAFDRGYAEILRPDGGFEPETTYWRSEDDEVDKLIGLLTRLFAEGYNSNEIVVLSARAQNSCAERALHAEWEGRLQPADAAPRGGVRYCTVHAYKGLEAPVVIVTDVHSLGTDADHSLFYVAVTRATERLFVLASSSLKPTILQLLLSRAK